MKRLLFLPVFCLLAACASFDEPAGASLRNLMQVDVVPEELGESTPQVSYSAEVLLARAEGYFSQRRFDEAAQEYARFMELHETHPWAAYALFREGMSYISQIQSSDREPGFPRRARQAFERLLTTYPDSPAVPYAKEKLAWVLDQQAAYELGVARFYLRTHREEAALGRLQDLIKTFPDTQSAKDALFDLGLALERTNQPEDAAAAYRAFLNTPDTTEDPKKTARAEAALIRLEGG
ncbi:MAG: outer membrane protein assembly factor BamD [Leptospirillia bacterium]